MNRVSAQKYTTMKNEIQTEVQQNDYCNSALKLKNDLETGFIVLGEYLHNIYVNNLWQASYSSWEEYTWELKMSSNHINKLMQIYRTLVLSYGLKAEHIITAGGWSVVADLLPMIGSKKDALKWLNKAQLLTRSDLRKEMKEAKTGVLIGSCSHDKWTEVTLCQCENCGDNWRKS